MNFIRHIVALLFAVAFFTFGRGDVLMWQVNGDANVDGSPSVYSFLASDQEIGALVCAYSADGVFIKNLNLVYDPDYADSFVDSKDSLWQMRAIQSYIDQELPMEALFQIQVGYYDVDENFLVVLYSSVETKMNLLEGHSYSPGTLYPTGPDWTPMDFYTINPVVPISPLIPEPSTSLLCIIGFGVLMLKRKV